MGENTNNAVYINSLEASDIYGHMVRGKGIKSNFCGMIPYSLELIQLRKQKEFNEFKTKRSKTKTFTDSIINVKFNLKVKSGENILLEIPDYISDRQDKLEELETELHEKEEELEGKKNNNRLQKQVEKLEKEIKKVKQSIKYYEEQKEDIEQNGKDQRWDEVGRNTLRENLYEEGFFIKQYDRETKEYIGEKHYKFYKRSSSKSRKGECWFIEESLHNKMMKWSSMGLDFDKEETDLAGLMSYESLVTSSIQSTLHIDPKSILIVDKVFSKFEDKANVIGLDADGKLKSVPSENHPIENEIFDGEGLLDSSLFKGDIANKGFVLLRQHFFKAACFNTDLQGFLMDYADEKGINFDDWYIKDMFNTPIKASDIKLVINPSCLKALKYEYAIGSQKDMFIHWKKAVKKDKNLFGICKYEKMTKRVDSDDEIPLQQLSYQMINSLPATKEQIKGLCKFELGYIDKLKNEPDRFMKYLERTKNNMNANEMFIDIYKINPDIIESRIYRDFKKEVIRKYREQLQSGKIRVVGDYCTMASCLVEYLLKVVGEIGDEIDEPLALKGNQLYTTLLSEGEVCGFRNPHVSPANLLLAKNIRPNKDENEYHKYFQYFNLTDNIVVVNSIKSTLPDTLNGCDWDSDTVLLTSQKDLVDIVEEHNDTYTVPVNNIPVADKVKYNLTSSDKAKIDNKLCLSQRRIGAITNLGQIATTLMWDEYNKKHSNSKKIKELLEIVNSLAVCSGLAIDGAKREYDLDLDKQINHYRKQLDSKLKKKEVEEEKVKKKTISFKPLFWKYVHNCKRNNNDNNPKPQTRKYETPMDWVFVSMSNLPSAVGVTNPKKLVDLLEKQDVKKANRRQKTTIEEEANKSQKETNGINASSIDDEEKDTKIEKILDNYKDKIGKIKINEKTMYALLKRISDRTEEEIDNKIDNTDEGYANLRIMNLLYQSHKELFLETFKKK